MSKIKIVAISTLILLVLLIAFLVYINITKEKPLMEKLALEWQQVDSIEVQNGGTGEISLIVDANDISQIVMNLNKIKVKQHNTSQREGFRYKLSFFIGSKRLLSIWTHANELAVDNGVIYKPVNGEYSLEMFEKYMVELLS